MLDPKKPPTGSSASISLELQGLMPFTSQVDLKALDVAVRYCKLTDSYETSAIKTPELDFGSWLVKTLYERKTLDENGGWGSMIGRLMAEPTINIKRKQ